MAEGVIVAENATTGLVLVVVKVSVLVELTTCKILPPTPLAKSADCITPSGRPPALIPVIVPAPLIAIALLYAPIS